MIYTKSILKQKDISDGIRISVMSRNTLNDGITPHPEIKLNSYDEWLRILAPSDNLVGDYYKKNIGWDLFRIYYVRNFENHTLYRLSHN